MADAIADQTLRRRPPRRNHMYSWATFAAVVGLIELEDFLP
jgi:hypothetical protein